MHLVVDNITKKYNGDKFGLRDFSISIKSGILGLLGPNGTGKSTLMKIIATISKPTYGAVLLNDIDIIHQPNKMRKILGYLPQDFGVYPNLNAFEFLEYIAAMKGVGGTKLRSRIEMLLDGLNLIEVARKPISQYSGGMKQRIGIAQALINDPKVIIFDEPTVGLDPEERVRFRNLISDLSSDRIVILSSHIVSDIETIADEIVVMSQGGLLAKGTQREIIKKVNGNVYEASVEKSLLEDFKKANLVINAVRENGQFSVRYIGHPIPGSISCSPNLEDAYLLLTKKR